MSARQQKSSKQIWKDYKVLNDLTMIRDLNDAD